MVTSIVRNDLRALLGIWAVFGIVSTAQAAELPNPEPPSVEIVGEEGDEIACYWVIAESDEPIGGLASHHVGSYQNAMTALSTPTEARLPKKLGNGGKVILRVHPIPGAKRYFILKTTPIPAPTATVTVKKSGGGTLYYWTIA